MVIKVKSNMNLDLIKISSEISEHLIQNISYVG